MGLIEKHDGTNIPGITKIQLIDLEQVTAGASGKKIPSGIDHKILGNIPAVLVHDVYFMENSAKGAMPRIQSTHGTTYKATVSVFIPATKVETLQGWQQLVNEKTVALVTYENGDQRLWGNDDETIEMTISEQNRKNINGYTATFSLASASPIPYFIGALV